MPPPSGGWGSPPLRGMGAETGSAGGPAVPFPSGSGKLSARAGSRPYRIATISAPVMVSFSSRYSTTLSMSSRLWERISTAFL